MTASILIIEHHDDHRVLIEAALRDDAVTIDSVETGEGALMRLGMSNFGCVVLGSPVPVTFGSESSTILDLFDLLAPNLASRLVIVTSGRSVEIVRRALKMQVHAIFLAPFDAAELREVVRICLRGETPPRRLYGTSAEIERLITQEPADSL
ncbi:MAG TPA: response regulator [Thermoanaerobaculia bacterium]|nr:response regulator [Thermoanaerobaculia bacterium]